VPAEEEETIELFMSDVYHPGVWIVWPKPVSRKPN
jgi:hypothetical protein